MTAPATTGAGESRLARVGLVVELLRRGWYSGQQIMSYVEIESERAGERTRYNNVQGATRNAKLRTLTDGRCWQYMDVNREMTGKGSAFRLWTITEEMVPRAHPAWQRGDAEGWMLKLGAEGRVIRRRFFRQHVDNVGDGRMASRRALDSEIAGSSPAPPARRRAWFPPVSGGAVAKRREEQGRLDW